MNDKRLKPCPFCGGPCKTIQGEALAATKIHWDEFEAWWEGHGQYIRAGGGQYEKTFAWKAWNWAIYQNNHKYDRCPSHESEGGAV